MTLRLSLRGVAKRYGEVMANDGISLDVAAGEIHALLGENGAGKRHADADHRWPDAA